MANPICLSPLKFYDSIDKQNHRKSYAFGGISPLLVKSNIIPPFQFVVSRTLNRVTNIFLYDANTDKKFISTDLATAFKDNGLYLEPVGDYKVLKYYGNFGVSEIKYEGLYYFAIHFDSGDIYYSEVFCCTNNVKDCIELTYFNPAVDFELKDGIISFSNGFRFKLLLRTELGRPEYEFEEEATSRLGYDFIESQVSKKIYKFTALVPEYLCDAMRIIRLCSSKYLKCLDETYDMLTFNMDIEWQDQGDIASAECEFEVDNVIVNIGTAIDESSIASGDFNNDFNNDFN